MSGSELDTTRRAAMSAVAVMGAVAASGGKPFRVPFALRLIK